MPLFEIEITGHCIMTVEADDEDKALDEIAEEFNQGEFEYGTVEFWSNGEIDEHGDYVR